ACLNEDDVQRLADCIRLDRDCADACAAAARMMARGGPLAREICDMCAEACDRCAAECERHAEHHDHCRLCAEACRKCAEECRRMAKVAA
ncbi:MAG TPA: four-helix bundle copper-binding protein, partial [Gemmatimonadaceae bacterium]|nr:four-helix bundle copper-binding protein [Gemmatimonadaceae bacterium]